MVKCKRQRKVYIAVSHVDVVRRGNMSDELRMICEREEAGGMILGGKAVPLYTGWVPVEPAPPKGFVPNCYRPHICGNPKAQESEYLRFCHNLCPYRKRD